MKILSIGEFSSSNLGDVAIGEAIRHLAAQKVLVDQIELTHGPVNDAARKTGISGRRGARKLLQHLVPPRQRMSIRWSFGGDRSTEADRYGLRIAFNDAVLIGGGQLLHANIALFDRRIELISQLCQAHHKPYALFGIGVSEAAVKAVSCRLGKVLEGARFVATRDELSKQRLERLGTGAKFCTVPDVVFGLTLERALPQVGRSVGLNVMAYESFIKFTERSFRPSWVEYCKFWQSACEEILRRRYEPVLFSSGTGADNIDLLRVFDSLPLGLQPFVRYVLPPDLESFKTQVAQFSAVVASRMHAGIIARALQRPVVAFSWDDKVLACWSMIGEEWRVISMEKFSAEGALDVLSELFLMKVPNEVGAKRRIVEVFEECCAALS